MIFASGFSWVSLLPGVWNDTLLSGIGVHMDTVPVLHSWLAAAVVILLAVVGRLSLEKARARDGLARYEADATPTPRNIAELFVETLTSVMGSVLSPKDIRAFFPLIGALFTYIFVSNVFGVFPGFLPPTDNANTNMGMAVIVFLTFNIVGIARAPVGYFKHMMGPVLFMAPLVFVIEIISMFVRPFSLWVRLAGNIFGDHTVFGVMSGTVPYGIPAIFLGLAIFVSLVQAFVFSLLSTIYIGLAVPHTEHDHD
ncbi:MAG: F0F1 ATP synthase subunit A [Deltaproteobacteria bacterium]|nr:F0F1 ATP synthase subunit A [Deltaproteobacteria bacterium]